MRAVLFHHEADQADTVVSPVVAFPESTSERAGPVASRSGSVELEQLHATILWWCDATGTAVQMALVSIRHDESAPAMSHTKQATVLYSRPIGDVYVTGSMHQGHCVVHVVACTADGEFAVTRMSVRRTDDMSLGAAFAGTTLHTPRLPGASPPCVVAIADASTLEANASTCTLVVTPDSFCIVAHHETTIREFVLPDISSRIGKVVAAGFDPSNKTIVAGVVTGEVVFARIDGQGLSVTATTSLGRGVTPRVIGLEHDAATGAVTATLVHATDSNTHSECVLRISDEAGQPLVTSRISGFGGARLVSLPVAVASGTAAFAWDHPANSRPLIAGVAARADGTTAVHCSAAARGPLRLPLALARAAFAVTTATPAEVQQNVMVAFGSSGRVRLYHASRDGASMLRLPAFAQRPSDEVGFARLTGAAPAHVQVVEALAPRTPGAQDELAPSPLSIAVSAGAAVFDAATDGPEALRQLIATAVARASALPQSEGFQRVCADAAANGFEPTLVSDDVILAAVGQAIDVRVPDAPHAAAFDVRVAGVTYLGNVRATAGVLLAELQSMLVALISVETARVSQRRTVSAHATTTLHRAIVNAAAAFAVVRACEGRIELLANAAMQEGALPHQMPAFTIRALLCVDSIRRGVAMDEALVEIAESLKCLPDPSCAVRATAAWTASWLSSAPVMRHFVLCDLLTRGCTRASSRMLFDHMQAAAAAINSIDGGPAFAIVSRVATDLSSEIPNEAIFEDIVADVRDDAARFTQRCAAFYTVCMTRTLVLRGLLSPDDLHKVVPLVESFLRLGGSGGVLGATELLVSEALATLLVDCHALLCRSGVVNGDVGLAVRCLQRLASLGVPGSDLAVEECAKTLVHALADAGRVGELVHGMVSHPTVSTAVARHLYDLVLDPRGAASSDRDGREERRVAMCAGLFAFLVARGASATAARVAFDTASAMRSAPRRTERTLDRSLKLLSLAVNTIAVMPTEKPTGGMCDDNDDDDGELSNTRNWSETTLRRDATTAFSAAGDSAQGAAAGPQSTGIGTLSVSDGPEVKRRWEMLRCEAKLAASGLSAPNCAPWSIIDTTPEAADADAANDVVKALIRARMWRDALILAEAWRLPAAPVFRSFAADLLEGGSDADEWPELLRWLRARSTVANNHAALQLTLAYCLSHAKYKDTPVALKDAMARHSSEGALATYLNRTRITGTILEDALDLGIRYCEVYRTADKNFAAAGLSTGIISFALLDRLHKLAQQAASQSKSTASTVKLAKQYAQAFTAIL